MKKILAPAAFAAIIAIHVMFANMMFAAAQPGPGPQPNPWVKSGNNISYSLGGILAPSSVTGGSQGVGTINAAGLFVNGSAVTYSVAGTANQITANTLSGVVTLSTPSTFVAPGSISATTSIVSGTSIAAGTSLTSTGATVVGTTLTVGSLTSGRVPYVGTGGLISDEAAFTYNAGTDTLTAVNFAGALTGNASTATALATARNIYGNSFDGTAALTQVIAPTYGGTNNAFTGFTGPASSIKTFTLPNADATILTTNAQVTVPQGGTNLTSGTSGGILAFTGTTTLASSGALTANMPVIGGGAGVVPSVGTKSGNTTQFVTTTGAQTSGNCVSIDASGNHIASGSACSSSPPGFAAYNTGANQTLTSGGASVLVSMTTEIYDSNGWYTASRFTPLQAGLYSCNASLEFSATSLSYVLGMFYKNGAIYSRFFENVNISMGSAITGSGSDVFSMNGSTDYIEIYTTATGTGTLQLLNNTQSPRFSCVFIRS